MVDNSRAERLAVIEKDLDNYKEYMGEKFKNLEKVVTKGFDNMANKIDEISKYTEKSYAKKDEVCLLEKRINAIETVKVGTAIERVKNKGLIITTAISSLSALLVAIFK